MLWFAFNILSLTYCTQLFEFSKTYPSCCDLLSISYLWHTVHNPVVSVIAAKAVVICFQYLIFDILYTTYVLFLPAGGVLWFAFNILSLTYCTQLCMIDYMFLVRCDLLSISYLWHTVHNLTSLSAYGITVVICFQYLIFDILYTTQGCYFRTAYQLWFAFNILSLTYCTQRLSLFPFHYLGCDLLSISYLWHTVHNE